MAPLLASLRRPPALAALLAAVAGLTLMVSLKHLADGIQRITQSSRLEAWACAVIFDLSYCVAELTLVVVPSLGLATRHKAAAYGVVFTGTATSITLNSLAFRANAQTTTDLILATSWDAIVPLLILVLGYLATSVLLAARNTPP